MLTFERSETADMNETMGDSLPSYQYVSEGGPGASLRTSTKNNAFAVAIPCLLPHLSSVSIPAPLPPRRPRMF
jgi:hypothetical protein